MTRLLIFIITISSMTTVLNAQKYNTAIGLRAGDDLGLVIDQRIGKRLTIQLMHENAMFSNRYYTSGTLRKHYPLITSRFNFYLGGGVFATRPTAGNDEVVPLQKGIQTTAGVELTIGKIQLSADLSPSAIIGQRQNSPRFMSSSGITAKYIIWRKKSKTKQRLKKLAFWNRIKLK